MNEGATRRSSSWPSALALLLLGTGCGATARGSSNAPAKDANGGPWGTLQAGEAGQAGGASQSVALGSSDSEAKLGNAGRPNVVFYDDFSDATLGPAWVAMDRHGDFGANDQACLTPGNVALAEGNLVLTSRVQARKCADSTHPAVASKYTSAMIQWKTLNFTYGTLEVRAKLGGGTGPWPAVWLLGANCQASNVLSADNIMGCNWPNAGSDEIDFIEVLSNDHTHVNQQIHSGANNSGCSASTSDVSQNFHTYKMVWKSDSLVWSIDGHETCRQTAQIPSTPMFVIINQALLGTVDEATLPQEMVVDYIELRVP